MDGISWKAKRKFVKCIGGLLAEEDPRLATVEYHKHERRGGVDEVAIVRMVDGSLTRVDITSLNYLGILHAILIAMDGDGGRV